jgi:diguanylate cyclase (GGDEF)-like protein
MVRKRHGSSRVRGVIALCAAVVWLGLMLGSAEVLAGSQANAHHAITQRLQTRIGAAADFASVYVRDIFDHERVQAKKWLAGRTASEPQLDTAGSALDTGLAMVLDAGGQVLQTHPADPGVRGTDVSLEYPYLATAVNGRAEVSNVVPSTDGGAPVIGFAVPFPTATGRRVFSVEFPVSRTPLGAYTNHLLTLPGNRVYLIDASEKLIAGGGSPVVGSSLAQHDPGMASALRHQAAGTYMPKHGPQQVLASARVAGTPWRIVATEPASEMFISLDGSGRTLAWMALAGLTLAGLVIIGICVRLARSRSQLTDLASQLHRLARVDPLTDLSNRRSLDETLDAALTVAQRAQRPLAVLLVDIDHFKQVNDTLGHDAGDAVLVDVAQAMRTALRAGDSLGRWGGEEFLAVLPDTDPAGATIVAERLREEVRRTVTACGRPVTVTIGVAVHDSDTPKNELITRADAALYVGKASGRDTVRVAHHENTLDAVLV